MKGKTLFSAAKKKRIPRILKTNIHTTAHAYCSECKVLIEVMGWQVPDNPEGGLEKALFEALNEKLNNPTPVRAY